MVLLQQHERLLAQDDQVLVLFDLAADAVDRGDVLVDLSVDQGDEERAADVLDGLQRLLVVVQIDEAEHQALVVDFADRELDRRLIEQVERDERARQVGHAAVGDRLQLDVLHEDGVITVLEVDLEPDLGLILRREHAPCK